MFCRFIILLNVLIVIYGYLIESPDFESDWLRITAQSSGSEIKVSHGLGTAPVLVDVLVKAIDGPNEGFIFKAIGHGERDDDNTLDKYGGVIYIYNDVSVFVMTPAGNNGNRGGAAIYTGSSPYWHGPNTQMSFSADIKVKCWTAASLPPPCVQITDIYMSAGSPNVDDTYKEIQHNQTEYPSIVKVRVQITNGKESGWYSDAQGSSAYNYITMGAWYVTGGLKFAYNNETIRIWTSSYPAPNGIIFARNDGWGNIKSVYGVSTAGYVEVNAWCNLKTSHEEVLQFGPGIINESMQFNFPNIYSAFEAFHITMMVRAVDGPNKGYLFDGIGGAMPNRYNIGQPCSYGGLVYARNKTCVRIWRPDYATGGAICISENMGHGTNSQASQSGELLFKVYTPPTFKKAPEYEPAPLVCSHFTIHGNDVGYNEKPIAALYNISTLLSCDYSCRQYNACVLYSYKNDTCYIYNTTDNALLYSYENSQVWGLKTRIYNGMLDEL
ncbi:uncharacterized protein LOC132736376 [Ruditapes philippinarum]|uniref:uncharacterized protein LOC132736376 n=1 Tax=Ruditapes philippinarum TaxID=129788 RepID=UPI00295BE12A|nr:uncharacterized protein LOC132736376 [Ruditapes philippinarum]